MPAPEYAFDADIENLVEHLFKLDGKLHRRISKLGLAAAARVARDSARKTTAFKDRTGNLRRSLKVRRRFKWVALLANRPEGAHGHLVELGHGGPFPARPHPFMVPAVLSTQPEQLKKAVARMRKYLKDLENRKIG